MAQACGTSPIGEIDRILQNLLWDYRGHRVALVFDEAQHLSIDCFETVRELFDQGRLFSLIFTGSHELDRVFRKFAGTLEQLERRLTDKITLPGVTRREAEGIVRSELQAVAGKCSRIADRPAAGSGDGRDQREQEGAALYLHRPADGRAARGARDAGRGGAGKRAGERMSLSFSTILLHSQRQLCAQDALGRPCCCDRCIAIQACLELVRLKRGGAA